MALDGGSAEVHFKAETKEFEAGTKHVSSQLHELSEQINGYAEGIKGALSFGIIGEGIKELTATIYEWGKSMAELGDQTERMQHMLGLTADQIEGFRYIAGSSGQSVEALSLGMQRLGYNAERAISGSKMEADAFKRLGVSIKDAHGNTKDYETLLEDVANSFSKHADGIEKNALAIQLFGRAGLQMIPALDRGSEEIKNMEQRALYLSGSMENATKAQVEFHQSTVDMDTAMQGFASELFREFEPAINEVLQQTVELIAGFRAWMQDSYDTAGAMRVLAFAADVVAAAVMTLIQLFRDLWDLASAVVNSLGDSLNGIGTQMEDVFTANWDKLAKDSHATAELVGQDWSKAWDDASKSSQTYADNIKKMFDATIHPPLEVTVGGGDGKKGAYAGPTDMAALAKAAQDAAAKMKAAIKDVQSTFQTFFQSMIGGFDKAITGLITGTMDWKQAMFSIIDGIWSQLVKMGEDWVAKWLANEATMLVASQTKDAAVVASQQAADDSSGMSMILNAIKSIFVSSRQTAAGVTANLAPLIGPAAIPAGAFAGATIAGLASFDVGSWNVPGDMQANVHQGEAIIPAAGGMADAFRDLAGAISSGGSVGGGGDIHFHGPVLDKAGLAAVLSDFYEKNPSKRPKWS